MNHFGNKYIKRTYSSMAGKSKSQSKPNKRKKSSSENTQKLIDENGVLRDFKVIRITGDGNCMFPAILECLDYSDDTHQELREKACDFIIDNSFV